jgi:hypothetical protein
MVEMVLSYAELYRYRQAINEDIVRLICYNLLVNNVTFL